MINTDKDALLCDLAETYHIYDYRSLPCLMVATFSCGLRENSRIKMKLSGENYSLDQRLSALMVDRLAELVWSKTKDAAKGRNKPKSIYEQMVLQKESDDICIFNTAEEFDAMRNKLIKGGTNG